MKGYLDSSQEVAGSTFPWIISEELEDCGADVLTRGYEVQKSSRGFKDDYILKRMVGMEDQCEFEIEGK